MSKAQRTAALKRQVKSEKWSAIYNEGRRRGLARGSGHDPTPMIVYEPMGMFDNRPKKIYEPVMDGCCGFAWVVIKPGNSSFAKWLKNAGLADTHYYGGMSIWVSDFGQSYERKMAYADEMADYFRSQGINAHSGGRLD